MKEHVLPELTQMFFRNASTDKNGAYQRITSEKAKAMIEEQGYLVILDVRNQDEYDRGHIPGAVLLPLRSIDELSAAEVIPTKDTSVLVYCQSGGRSKTAAKTLVGLGYTQIYDLGGIVNWPYEIEQ